MSMQRLIFNVLTIDVKRRPFYGEQMTIRSFRCADTEALYQGLRPRRFRNIEATAERSCRCSMPLKS
jgi:hypothetical protein